MTLSRRLKAIADKTPVSDVVADIGTDHGYIPVYLIKKNIAQMVIASDISEASLAKAQNLIKQEGLYNKIVTKVGDGISILKPGEADTVIIAGMGGLVIENILKDNQDIAALVDTFILQPMSSQDKLRYYLLNNGYNILDEQLVLDEEKFYEIIVARHGELKNIQDIDYEIGYRLIENKDPLLGEFLKYKMGKIQKIIDSLNGQNTHNARKRLTELNNKMERYMEVYKWLMQ